MSKLRYIFTTLFIACTLLLAEAKLQLSLESRDLQINVPFEFDLVISNAKNISEPIFPKNPNFRLLNATPFKQNSTNISVINGKVTKNIINNTTYQLKLLPLKTGALEIPTIEIIVDSKRYKTEPVSVTVSAEEQITDIALELTLAETKCYVGQPIMATWRWYIGRKVEGYDFTLPLLEDETFTIPEIKYDQPPQNACRILNQTERLVIGLLSRENWKGFDTQCVEFSLPIIPKRAGTFKIDAGSVICEVLDKHKRRRQSNSFWDMNPFMREATKQVSIQGNVLELEVAELPAIARPNDFSGIIGKCSFTVSANPTDVNVGDPIVLDICIGDLPYPEIAHLPPMSTQQKLIKNFRVSDEDEGTIKDDGKHFQCTIRALSPDITEIPQLNLSYFDTASGKYETISTKAIPLVVHAVKTITALDAVNVAPASGTQSAASLGKQIKALDDGIAHNYDMASIARQKRAGFRNWSLHDCRFIFCGALAMLYLLCAAIAIIIRRRNASPEKLAAKAAATQAWNIINSNKATAQEIATAIHSYFRAKLMLPAGADTFADLKPALIKRKIGDDALSAVKSLFEACEAIQYSGGTEDTISLQKNAIETINKAKLQ